MKSEDCLGVRQLDERRRVFWAERGEKVKFMSDETA